MAESLARRSPDIADDTLSWATPADADQPARLSRSSASASGRPQPKSFRRLLRHPAAVLGCVLTVGSLLYFWKAWGDPATTFPGGPGDPEQFQFFLAWPIFALTHGLNPLVTHYVLYPAGTNLMWNTSVLFPGLLLSPVTLLWGPTATYDVLLALAPITNGLAAYAAFRRWTRPWPAALGGLLFGLSPFVFAQAQGHLHLVLVRLVPIVLLLLDEILVRQRWRWWASGAALGGAAAAQLLTAEEILAFVAVLAALGIALLAALRPRDVARHASYAARAAAAAVVTFAALAGYPLWMQFRGPYRVTQPIHDATVYVNDALNTVIPVNEWAGGGLGKTLANGHWTGNASEWNAYLGIPLLVIATVVAWRCRRSMIVRISAVLLVVAELFSFGFELHVDGHYTGIPVPWAVFERAPVLEQAIASRWSLFADLFGALLVAVFADRVLPRLRPRLRLLGMALAAATVVSWLPGPTVFTTVAEPAYLAAGGPVHRLPQGSVALLLPLVDAPGTEHAQLWLARSGFPVKVPEGYVIVPGSHSGPPTYTQTVWDVVARGEQPTAQAATWMTRELRAWHVREVVVGPWPGHQDAAVALLERLFPGSSPRWYGDTAVFDLAP